MSFKEDFNYAVRKLVERKTDEVVTEIVSWDEESYETGGCETCAWTVYEVRIHYRTEGGRSAIYVFDGRFSELIYELTRD